jgi:integrase
MSYLASLHSQCKDVRSRTTIDKSGINYTLRPQLSPALADLLEDATAANTKKAYRSDLRAFVEWGGSIPSTPEEIGDYLAEHAGRLKPSTLQRRLAAIKEAHDVQGYAPSPTAHPLVKAALKAVRRRHGTSQTQAKPILPQDLSRICGAMGGSNKDLRDQALLLIGFAGAFRRSELVALQVEDIIEVDQGLIVTIRHAKNDQTSKGREIGISFEASELCPVRALQAWLDHAGIHQGPLFRGLWRDRTVREEALSVDAVNRIIKRRLADAGEDPKGYSGHSLRAGFVTAAAKTGASSYVIRRQTGHASDQTVARYIRNASHF